MEKPALRKKYKALRAVLTEDTLEEDSLAIANQALKLDIWDYEYYHIFLPIIRHKEVNTEYLLNILQGKDKNVLLSKSDFETNTMKNYLLTDSTKIVVNKYGIPEPEDGIEIAFAKTEVIFIPLLAYDKMGNRVGYGKGFYDRFLSKCNPKAIKIGLSFFSPENKKISSNDTDVSLNYCISPKTICKF